MIQLDPTPAGFDPEADLINKIVAVLGHDLVKVLEEDEKCDGYCPCCQVVALLKLMQDEREACYRKGWHHVIDGTTPSCPDLVFGDGDVGRAANVDGLVARGPWFDEKGNAVRIPRKS